jgi:hypothetical protein
MVVLDVGRARHSADVEPDGSQGSLLGPGAATRHQLGRAAGHRRRFARTPGVGAGSASILRPKARGHDMILAEGQVPSRQQISECASARPPAPWAPARSNHLQSCVGFRKAHRFCLWIVDSPPRMEGRNVAGVRRAFFRWFSSPTRS